MLHTVLISLHTAAATISFLAGAAVLRPRVEKGGQWQFRAYQLSLISAIVFVIIAIGTDWSSLTRATRAVFSGLAILGLYMIWRALMAGSNLRRRPSGWPAAYVGNVGFTLISLFDAFVIVLTIDLGGPGWLVAMLAVLGIAAGMAVIRKVQRTLPS